MDCHGSPGFQAYSRNLHRLLWAEFIDAQVSAANQARYQASVVVDLIGQADNLVPAYDYHRHRALPPAAE